MRFKLFLAVLFGCPIREALERVGCAELRVWRMAYDLGLFQPEYVAARGFAAVCNMWRSSSSDPLYPNDFVPADPRQPLPPEAVQAKAHSILSQMGAP